MTTKRSPKWASSTPMLFNWGDFGSKSIRVPIEMRHYLNPKLILGVVDTGNSQIGKQYEYKNSIGCLTERNVFSGSRCHSSWANVSFPSVFFGLHSGFLHKFDQGLIHDSRPIDLYTEPDQGSDDSIFSCVSAALWNFPLAERYPILTTKSHLNTHASETELWRP